MFLTCFLGISSVWPLDVGLVSRKAVTFSVSYTLWAGISPFVILQNMQFFMVVV